MFTLKVDNVDSLGMGLQRSQTATYPKDDGYIVSDLDHVLGNDLNPIVQTWNLRTISFATVTWIDKEAPEVLIV